MERWEREAYKSFENAQEKLRGCRELRMDCNEEKDGPLWYVDIGYGNLTWTSYNLILQFCREQRKIVICADPANLKHGAWSGWTEVLLDKLCPRTDWENRRANFILHMKADIEIADREHQWFKFMLHHQGGHYTKLEHTIFTSQKYIKKDAQGQRIDSKVYTSQIPLNFRVQSFFQGLCEANEIFHGSDIERCFSPFLYPPA